MEVKDPLITPPLSYNDEQRDLAIVKIPANYSADIEHHSDDTSDKTADESFVISSGPARTCTECRKVR